MTNLEMLKLLFMDLENKIISNEEYTLFLQKNNLEPSETYTEGNFSLIELTKADILEAFLNNPEKLTDYTKGEITKKYKKEMLYTIIRNIRNKYVKLKVDTRW